MSVEAWKKAHGYDKPRFYNVSARGWQKITNTLFFQKSLDLFIFKFGSSDQGRDISYDISQRMWPSLAIAIPTLLIGVLVSISFALLMALFRGTVFDTFAIFICVVMMSISSLFFIIIGQYFFGTLLRWVPISGYQSGWQSIKFVILPIIIGVISSLGAVTRWYRTLFLEEINKNYVRTARSKGLAELKVLFKHVLKNALIPILTSVVVLIPTLFLGSLILESFFGIPGLGSYTIDAIGQQDFNIVRVMVFLGTLFYILGLILTDISYTLVDPRVRLSKE